MDNEQQKLFQTVEHIMKSPELVGIINELRGSGDPSGDNAVSQTEILSHLPEVTAMLRPLLGDTSADAAASTAEEVQEVQDVRPVSAAPSPKKYDKARAEKLMSALKPYLSKNRCDMIDKCVSVIQLTDVVEALQGLEGLTKQSRPKP